VTKRAENDELLESFRSWARSNGAQEQAQHAKKLVTVQLTDTDYDVELATDYGAMPQQQPQTLAQLFVDWWDGDHGESGVARNLVIIGTAGNRLLTQRI
jgi:hypothetical protein